MSLDPIHSASLAIQIHVLAAFPAILLGPVALYRRRRDRLHKSVGYLWVAAMLVLALSSFFIEAAVLPFIGPYGPIHLFAIWALYSIWQAMRAIYGRDVARHQRIMCALYWQALGLTGLLTLLPGRRMNEMVFGDASLVGVWVIVGSGLLAGLVWGRRRWRVAQ